MWMVPSVANVYGADPRTMAAAAVSNGLFYVEHMRVQTDRVVVTAPDGRAPEMEHAFTGHCRRVFDVHLSKAGTYKIAVVDGGFFANHEVVGQKRRWRGEPANFAKKFPAGTKRVYIRSIHRLKAFCPRTQPVTTVTFGL